jgi:hypothetical protein
VQLAGGAGGRHRRDLAGDLQQLRGGHVADARPRLGFADLQRAGHHAGELVPLSRSAAGDGQREDHPLGLGQAGPGQLPVQDRAEGLLGLADDASAESWIGGHRLPPHHA